MRHSLGGLVGSRVGDCGGFAYAVRMHDRQAPPGWREKYQPGALAVLLALSAVCVWLGFWQLDRAQLLGSEPERPVHELTAVVRVGETLSEEAVAGDVTATGAYAVGDQLRVVGGASGGSAQAHDWVVTRFEVAGTDGLVSVAVVRGSVPAGAPLAVPPTGEVTVQGRLMYAEPAPEAGVVVGPGETTTVNTADLMNRWGTRLVPGYVLLAEQSPPSQVSPVPPPTGGAQWAVRNVLYAIQWWVFAVFGPVLWWRMVQTA